MHSFCALTATFVQPTVMVCLNKPLYGDRTVFQFDA